MKKIKITLCTLVFISNVSFAQNNDQGPKKDDIENIYFRDTIYHFVFDSIRHDLGDIIPQNTRLVKHFKYIGTEPIYITKAWTRDPHFICNHPKGLIEPDNIYSFTVCFVHSGRSGKLNKEMGFFLSDGSNIRLKFTGLYPQKIDSE